MSGKWIVVIGALLSALAIVSGAFGAHALKAVLTERTQGWYDTAVTYHTQQALAVLACGVVMTVAGGNSWLSAACLLLLAGIFLFSGSLYLMTFTGWTRLGMVTPIGGLLLILGWLCFALGALRLPAQ